MIEVEYTGELIPGKYCQGIKKAFYCLDGQEHLSRYYKLIEGYILPKGQKPDKEDEIGFQIYTPGKFYVGFTYFTPNIRLPGKVKDNILYYGYKGKEYQATDF